MKKIDFDNIVLLREINDLSTQYVKCIDEYNFLNPESYKCLNLKASYNMYDFGIRLFIQENDNNITIDLLAENICKNIDVDDAAMEIILDEIFIIANLVRHKLEEYISTTSELQQKIKSIEFDTMITNNNFQGDKFNLEEFKSKINNLYNNLRPDKVEYSNETNKLFVFTNRGRELAKVLDGLNISSFVRTRSGYSIKFLEKTSRCTNSFIDKIAKELSNMGIPSMSAPDLYLDYSW